jgi:hypothetical protein
VKLLRAENDRYLFQLAEQESALLALILRLYPVIPSAHQPLSKSSAKTNEANQRLLDDALAEQRNENKKLVESFLADSRRFQKTDTSCRLILSAADVEWLLQVLNDIRVGSWILLGSPEEELPVVPADDPKAPHAWAMDLAGFFQMNLLRATSGK